VSGLQRTELKLTSKLSAGHSLTLGVGLRCYCRPGDCAWTLGITPLLLISGIALSRLVQNHLVAYAIIFNTAISIQFERVIRHNFFEFKIMLFVQAKAQHIQ